MCDIEEGVSGLGRTPSRYKVLPGPSTDKNHPLLTDNYSRDYNPPPAHSNSANGTVVTDMISGLFNDDLVAKAGQPLIVGFGLPGIADGAYSPPYGWRFSRIVISGYR